MDDGNWIFGYGSLMWAPDFPVAEQVIAQADGWRRSFCLLSVRHRGTDDCPGLVLALEPQPGQVCTGVALRVPDADWPGVIAAIRDRELVTGAYREAALTLALADGRRVEALTYVIQPGHAQYAAGLMLEEQARIIAAAQGGRGPNRDYLYNTVAHLTAMGIPDDDLSRLEVLVRRIAPQD